MQLWTDCVINKSIWIKIRCFQHGTNGWIWEEGKKVAAAGHFELLKLLSGRKRYFPMEGILPSACRHGDLEMVEWAHGYEQVLWNKLNLPPTAMDLTSALTRAVGGGNLRVAEWLHARRQQQQQGFSNCSGHIFDQETVRGACRHGDLKLMHWVFSVFGVGDGMKWKFFREAACQGQLGLVEWMISSDQQFPKKSGDTPLTDICSMVAERGHFDVLRFLLQHMSFLDDQKLSQFIDAAAKGGHLEIVEWLNTSLHARCTRKASDGALSSNHVDFLNWLWSNWSKLHADRNRTSPLPPIFFPHKEFWKHAMEGRLRLLEWFHERGLLSGDTPTSSMKRALGFAAMKGHIHLVEWLHQVSPDCCTQNDMAITQAARNGHLKTMEWLLLRRSTNDSSSRWNPSKAMRKVSREGHLNVLEWLRSNENFTNDEIFDEAAGGGQLHILQWLHKHQLGGGSVCAMDDAAQNNHAHVIEWLHANRREGCSKLAMDSVARQGNLRLLEWFHRNRSEGCTTAAMDFAASRGKLSVVEWLHWNRKEGCTTDAMDLAARHGHLAVLAFLHKWRDEGLTGKAFAPNAGYLQAEEFSQNVRRWLQCNRQQDFLKWESSVTLA